LLLVNEPSWSRPKILGEYQKSPALRYAFLSLSQNGEIQDVVIADIGKFLDMTGDEKMDGSEVKRIMEEWESIVGRRRTGPEQTAVEVCSRDEVDGILRNKALGLLGKKT
jgi:hypothetical protein